LPELSLILTTSLLSLMANLAILTLYFSEALSGFASKHIPRKDGFLLSLSGLTVATVYSTIIPFLPETLSLPDIAFVFALTTWIALLHYRYQEGWMEALVEAIIGGIIYLVVLAIVAGFLILWISM
jgi:hypothetical protein